MKTRVIFLFLIIFSNNAFAVTYPVNGNGTWNEDRDYSGNGTSANGIFITNNANSGTITTNYNIESSDNYIGIYAAAGGQITIINGDIGKIFTANNNKDAAANWRTGYGIYANGMDASNTYASTINIRNMNIEANENGSYGIYANAGGLIDITGVASGANILQANGNRDQKAVDTWTVGIGLFAAGSNATNNYNSTINIRNMDIEANGNGLSGIYTYAGGLINITGIASGANTLQASGNREQMAVDTWTRGTGFYVSSVNGANRSTVNINNMNIEANGNGSNGIYVNAGGLVDITGIASGSNTLQANGNRDQTAVDTWTGGNGLYVIGVNGANRSTININNMNIEANENGLYGMLANGGGLIDITGVTSGANILQANGNRNQTAVDTWTAGYGVYANGADGGSATRSTINIRNMNIEANGNGLYGILAQNGGQINIVGVSGGTNMLQVNNNYNTNNNGRGIFSSGANSEINISNMNIELINNKNAGLNATAAGKISITGSGQSLVVKNHSGEGINSSDAGSIIDITGMNIYAEGNAVFKAQNNSAIALSDTTVNVSDDSTLANFDNGSGTFSATNSVLNNRIVTIGSGVSNVTLTNSAWHMHSGSNITNLSNAGSLINLASTTSGAYNTLTVSSYTAAGDARLHLNTYFDGDGTTTDKLVVSGGSSSGSTTLHITSTGATGDATAADGIMVVDQSAALSGGADFSLAGGVVDSGYWEYELFQGDAAGSAPAANNYYLRSNGRISSVARTIANLPAVHLNLIKTGMNESMRRLGDLREGSHEHKNGLWVRSFAKHMNVHEKIDTDLDVFGIEAGYDHKVYADCDDVVFAGLMSGIMYSGDIKTSNDNTGVGRANADTPSVGIYGTWMNRSGWFADAVARHFWSNMNAVNTTANGDVIKYGPDREFTAASLELGKRIDITESIKIEPKVEAQYAIAQADKFGTNIGNEIKYGETQSLVTKAALSLGYRTKLENGAVLNPYLQAGLLQEWDGKTNIEYAGRKLDSNQSGFGYEAGGGLNIQIDSKTAFYGQVMYENGEVIESVNANLGVRWDW